MLNKMIMLAAAAALAALLTPSKLDAWGAAHVGYTHVGPGGVYHTGRTVAAGPGGVYAGGRTGAYGAYGGAYRAGYGGAVGYGGAAYGGYHYGYAGGYGYGAARYGYIR
jgi:heterogeneous nuclear ribonucleoprotein A1/A3